MGLKVTFDPVEYRIVVTTVPISGVITLNFKVDVYSDGKEDWLASVALARNEFPIRAVGGEPLPGGLFLDATYFISPPWKIYPYDADHEVIVQGNVYRTDGASIFLPRAGRTVTATLLTTFSAGASGTAATPTEIANAVAMDTRTLTMGKFLALK